VDPLKSFLYIGKVSMNNISDEIFNEMPHYLVISGECHGEVEEIYLSPGSQGHVKVDRAILLE
jgi:hypothetical protein